MELFRFEYDLSTGELTKIYQEVYEKEEEIVVVDKGKEPPEGYSPVEPE